MIGIRKLRDQVGNTWMWLCIILVLSLPFAILFGLVWKAYPLFDINALGELILSTDWQPAHGAFGFLPFILSSVIITVTGLLLMVPLGFLPALYLTQYASPRLLSAMRSVIDMLAGIPSVIHGVWGVLVVVPLVGNWIAPVFGRDTAGYTILAGSIVLAVSVIPFILHMLLEVFRGIPTELKEASLSLGATYWETIKKVVIRQAIPGLIAAYALGLSKAFGETIAVLMVVGNMVQIPGGLLEAGYPLPALIANNYGEMLSIPLYDAALMFAALLLFVMVSGFNLASRFLIQRTTTY